MNTQYIKELLEAASAGLGVFGIFFMIGWSLSLWQAMVGGIIMGIGSVLGVLWGRYIYIEHHDYVGDHMDYQNQY